MRAADTRLYILARDPMAAKTRLAPILDPGSRAELAAAMLEDVLAVTGAIPFASRMVVTESDAVRRLAAHAGAETLAAAAEGTDHAAVVALADATAAGARSALVLVADLPLLRAEDLERLLAEEADVVIAPDRHRIGTNALLLTPPSVIAPAFGADSFQRHRDNAARARATIRMVASRGVAMDLDSTDDLRAVLRESRIASRTADVLGSLAVV
jgi:2-phospho-L-lactate guanylyltransferase